MDRWEVDLCLRFNRLGEHYSVRQFFKLISRLGDGVAWYAIALCLPLLYGLEGLAALAHVTLVGLVCVAAYRQLKNRLVRQRPFIAWQTISAHTQPLDRYSFPSGHTMNAVNFTLLFTAFMPGLIWFTLPFTVLIALSRVILGMHYPSDVLVGALLGALIASMSLMVWPLGMFHGLL